MPLHSGFRGFIIRKNDFGESNTVFTVIDADRGKVEIAAFGSKKESSSRRSSIIVTNLVSGIMRQKDEHGPYSLKEITTERSFPSITASLPKVSYIYFLFEVLDIVLARDNRFTGFQVLLDAMVRSESGPAGKYVFYALDRVLASEGLMPDPRVFAGGDNGADLTGAGFQLGNGSARFIRDSLLATSMDYLDAKELSGSVAANLVDFFSKLILNQFGRELRSLSLLRPVIA